MTPKKKSLNKRCKKIFSSLVCPLHLFWPYKYEFYLHLTSLQAWFNSSIWRSKFPLSLFQLDSCSCKWWIRLSLDCTAASSSPFLKFLLFYIGNDVYLHFTSLQACVTSVSCLSRFDFSSFHLLSSGFGSFVCDSISFRNSFFSSICLTMSKRRVLFLKL